MGTIMKTRIFNIILVAMVALGSIFTSCSDDADSFVLRSDDNLNFTYAQDSKNKEYHYLYDKHLLLDYPMI